MVQLWEVAVLGWWSMDSDMVTVFCWAGNDAVCIPDLLSALGFLGGDEWRMSNVESVFAVPAGFLL